MSKWVAGNKFLLLENGEAFFPRVFECIAAAEQEVLLETFILFEDKVGLALQQALLTAARRGVQIDITIDGYGSPDLSPAFILALTQAGVRVHVFDPSPRLWGLRTNLFRRMHRKIVVIDGHRAFVGGINYSADHLADFGPEAKQDYAVEMEGPLVAEVHQFVRAQLLLGQQPPAPGNRLTRLLKRRPGAASSPAAPAPAAAGPSDALFVTRDNVDHRSDIERHYRIAIRGARRRIIIANAYFFPGYRLLRQLRKAARRGVDVRLILQGEPDMPIVKIAAGLLYHHLLGAGVKVYEYHERPLHGKVALTDDEWSTVGSSNLDPLSLSLNLEANVLIKDSAFNQHLGERLEQLMQNSCTQIRASDVAETGLWANLRSFFVFHLLRRYPAWFGWLPAHTPRLTLAEKLLGQTEVDTKVSHVNEGRVS
ncbi:cardiolipin synthase ClsB [Polaromonas sp.]|uniref:cardiolipin synthase ClsB n=1 Tax=Polaromonas sp. TaxID=1869339 RepID=UPI00248A7FE0|nr:cardiolipin synthase ClsB [Polaromonas sp.]MDI1274946.1 cardiolipin synthase ClsB [Polaromonas sp.]